MLTKIIPVNELKDLSGDELATHRGNIYAYWHAVLNEVRLRETRKVEKS